VEIRKKLDELDSDLLASAVAEMRNQYGDNCKEIHGAARPSQGLYDVSHRIADIDIQIVVNHLSGAIYSENSILFAIGHSGQEP
jgi:hypothetical protein